MLVGYMRVSTSEQNLALQRDALDSVVHGSPVGDPNGSGVGECLSL